MNPPPMAGEIFEGPDGYYWMADGELGPVGPFDSYEAAQADRDAPGEDAPETGETLQEAQGEVGINEWLDESGEPAEGQSPPHIERE